MNVWDKTVGALRELVEPYDFKHWIQPVACEDIDEKEGRLTLRVPDASHGEWIQENFLDHIRQAMREVSHTSWSISFRTSCTQVVGSPEQGNVRSEPTMSKSVMPPRLIPHYRFDQFVHGPNNQFALTAARAVAERPGFQYNPLFLYGGVGLGKTHLLHAIGHEVRRNNPNAQVLYVTSETFVNDLIRAIRTGRMDDFRERYRDNCDVLLIDDIQFIAGKDRTQEEFFHMFNTLHSYGKQIVLTCDQLPRSIPDMEDRLRSRLEWGLIADIKPPSFETRVAIVRSKAEIEGAHIEPEVAMFLARHIDRNVRELEGALRRLIAQSRIFGSDITMGMVQDVLNQMNLTQHQHVSIGNIIKTVARDFNLAVADLKGPRRQRSITLPRQIAMLLARELTESSLPQIGQAFGGRDHTTVINSLKRMELLSRTKPELMARVERLRKELTS